MGHADKQTTEAQAPEGSQELLEKYKQYENTKDLVKDDNPYR